MSLMPEGVKVYFGKSLDKKLEIEEIIRGVFQKNGYTFIELPIYDYYEDVKNNFSEKMRNNMFKFIDRDTGKVIVLRPDMTSLLAKLIKIKKENSDFPKRICYMGDIFRHDKIKSGTYREISQAGIEMIGAKENYQADVEVLIVAIEVMKALGVKNPKVEISDLNILNSILERETAPEKREKIKELISKKDIPGLELLIKETGYTEILKKIPMMIGKKEILDNFKEEDTKELRRVLNILDELGYSENYILDMGMVKEMEYYTGLVFNGFFDGVGDYVISGGRYDTLMGVKALGFVVNIDATVEVFEKKENKIKDGYYIYGSDYMKNLKMKKELSEKGEKIEIAIDKFDFKTAKIEAIDKKFKFIINTDNDEKYDLTGVENDE